MKLTLIGGGGVRAPLFVAAALRRAERVGLEELCLMDVDAEKLAIFGGLCRAIALRAGSRVRITATTDPRAALEGAKHIVTTIRVGFEQGRVLDEQIALKHGVLGQETTGPGGFAMALRTIPAMLEYARLIEEVAADALVVNFTNPVGIIVQAVTSTSPIRIVGVCDGPIGMKRNVAELLGVPGDELHVDYYG